MPIDIPVNLGSKVNKEEVIDTVSHAPLHELLAYTMCLQVIEWGIKSAGAENQGISGSAAIINCC